MYITFLPSGRVTRLLLVTTANGWRPRAWRISLTEYDSSAPPNLATDSGKSYNLILWLYNSCRTVCLNWEHSSGVRLSALPIITTTFT